ncbi:general vesicular transport factor p115 isoform X2 [Macrosteles quadrilineatus]|uniref:general vesicular transport factor p115 isoform X2 n=1 Tax=Macrosteles quadrilineatus TaxID=74068 RepID=UPI0023E15765|nr:general vesicular transport factor p115 isoform X2 [Macrosteles quadrilineatus]
MEYFKSGLKSVLGAPQPGAQPSGAETVERLVDRVQSSTLLDDRRDACRALKALSRKYRVEVGAQGMDALRQVLEMDHNDCEIVGYVLDTLCNITSPEIFEEEERPDLSHESLSHVGEQFTEIFIKKPENVGLVLSFMEEYEFQVRWPAVKLLTTLLANKPRDIQEIILVSPMGVSKMMDLLGDSRDVIRNEALLLLIQLTKGNANIQKIVAFENAFDRLFEVIKEEGGADGGIVVEDCLLLMLNLLRNNTSNQNFFKEGSYIQRLAPMFTLPPEGEEGAGWSSQKVANIHCVLQILRTLVSPGNPAQVTASCQRALHASGILEALCHMLMAGGVPVDTLTETICALAEAIRGNHGNQQYFTTVMAPSTPPREAIVVLLMSMVNEKQPFLLRCAVLYCFQCFLFQNEEGQRQLVKTLLPSTTEVVNLSSGQLLCGGLFSHDPLSNWFSAIALSHALIENPEQREELLRVLLAANTGNTPVSLLHQATQLLQHSSKVQSKLGLLMLLCTWLAHCPAAVKQFLSIPSSIPYLTAQAGSTERDDNEELVQGVCAFLIGICVQFNDDSVTNFTKENLRHLIEKRIGHEVFLAKLGEVSRHEQYSKASKHPELKPRSPAELLLDHEFCKLFKALEGMIIKTVTAKTAADLLNGDMELSPAESAMVLQYKDLIREQDKRLHDLQLTVDSLRHENHMLAAQNEELNNSLAQLRDQNMVLRAQVSSGGMNTEEDETAELRAELKNKETIIKELNEELNEAKISSSLQKTVIAESSSQNSEERLRDELTEAHQRLAELTEESMELARLKRDQEDLLELLADQDAKLGNFKVRLRALGEKVDEDEDQDLDDDVDLPSEELTSQSLA